MSSLRGSQTCASRSRLRRPDQRFAVGSRSAWRCRSLIHRDERVATVIGVDDLMVERDRDRRGLRTGCHRNDDAVTIHCGDLRGIDRGRTAIKARIRNNGIRVIVVHMRDHRFDRIGRQIRHRASFGGRLAKARPKIPYHRAHVTKRTAADSQKKIV